jgi:hypothetical protein
VKYRAFKDPDEYLAALDGWRRACVESLRKDALAVGNVEEVIKWGHLVYQSNGPAFLIRAEDRRVLFGFWRGQRLVTIEPRLEPGGKYEMATIEIQEGETVSSRTARKLIRKAIDLNRKLGDPRHDARR